MRFTGSENIESPNRPKLSSEELYELFLQQTQKEKQIEIYDQYYAQKYIEENRVDEIKKSIHGISKEEKKKII